MKRNLAFIGPQGSGKSTISHLLCEFQGYTRMAIADPIKEIANAAYPGLAKEEAFRVRTLDGAKQVSGRELLQDIGAKMREIDLDFWLRQFRRRYLDATRAGMLIVIDDVRLSHEVEYLQQIDPLLSVVRIHAHATRRAERIGKVIGADDITETGWNLAPFDFSLDTTDLSSEDAAQRLVRWMEEAR